LVLGKPANAPAWPDFTGMVGHAKKCAIGRAKFSAYMLLTNP